MLAERARIGHYACAPELKAGNAMASDEEYVLTKDFTGEHERLLLLEDHVDSLSVEAIEAVGIASGARCLEIGGGAGSIARWFAAKVGDPRFVTAIDLDTRLLQPLAAEGISEGDLLERLRQDFGATEVLDSEE